MALLLAIFLAVLISPDVSGRAISRLIVPGTRIGVVKLGEDSKQLAWLGQAKGGDAAMGHFWGFWRSGSLTHTLGIYTVRNEEGDKELVRQIFIDSPNFSTANGIRVGSTLRKILSRYPNARRITSPADSEPHGVLQVYDDAPDGISFQVGRSGPNAAYHCFGILVHQPGRSVTNEYSCLPDDTRWGQLLSTGD